MSAFYTQHRIAEGPTTDVMVSNPAGRVDPWLRPRLPCAGSGRGSREELEPGTFAYTAAGDREGFAELLLELAEELRAEIPVGNG